MGHSVPSVARTVRTSCALTHALRGPLSERAKPKLETGDPRQDSRGTASRYRDIYRTNLSTRSTQIRTVSKGAERRWDG